MNVWKDMIFSVQYSNRLCYRMFLKKRDKENVTEMMNIILTLCMFNTYYVTYFNTPSSELLIYLDVDNGT